MPLGLVVYFDLNINLDSFKIILMLLIHPNPTFRPSHLEILLINDIFIKNNITNNKKYDRLSKSVYKEIKSFLISKNKN